MSDSHRTCSAIRHVSFEDLGAFASAIDQAGYAIEYLDIGETDLRSLDFARPELLVVLGGPISVYDDSIYPFIHDELRIVARRLALNLPTMGICLGAQLIARAAGARVYPTATKEIGIAPIELTEAGRSSCLAPFADDPLTMHWHGDTFDLPTGAALLASSAVCQNQAFEMGSNVIGFQFHPEAGSGGFEKWLVGHAAELAATDLDVRHLRASAEAHGPALAGKAERVAARWLAGLQY